MDNSSNSVIQIRTMMDKKDELEARNNKLLSDFCQGAKLNARKPIKFKSRRGIFVKKSDLNDYLDVDDD